MNVLVNAIDAVKNYNKTLFDQEIFTNPNTIVITININSKDAANGIPVELPAQIFAPTFTSKTVSQATRLVLQCGSYRYHFNTLLPPHSVTPSLSQW
jgi:C4-dicarboxylate-specific signal transduction histidine kinase